MREMKDSGVEWIGEIPKTWNIYRNKNVMKKIKNIKDVYTGEKVLSLTMNGVVIRDLDNPYGKMPTSFDGYQYIEKGNLLMCLFDIDVTPRCIGLIKDNGVTSPAYSQFELLKDNYSPYYYYYYLYLDNKKELLHLAKNLRHSFTESQLGELQVPVPPVEEQKRIVDYLDKKCSKIDEIIEKQQAIIEKLKEYKLSVITEAVTKGLNPNAEMKKSSIRKLDFIPQDWNEIKITRMLDYNVSYPIGDGDHGLIKTIDYKDEGIPYLRVQNLGWGTDLLLDNTVYISEQAHSKIKSSELHPGDILFCKTGATIGKTGMIPENIKIANTTSHVGKITLSKIYNPRFVFYYLSSHIGFVQFWDIACLNTTRPELGIDKTKSIKIAIPNSLSEQDKIVHFLDKKCNEIEKILFNKIVFVERLEKYKKSLIYEVVTGKKEV